MQHDSAEGRQTVPIDVRSVDIFEFARNQQQASGRVSVAELPRMVTEVPPGAPAPAEMALNWRAYGEMRAVPGGDASGTARQPCLVLALEGDVWLECQRCLQPYSQPLEVETVYRIVETEEQADAVPMDDDEADVVVGSRRFDLLDLIDEELVLALPLVPKHEICPAVHQSLVTGPDGDVAPPAEPAAEVGGGNSAFAALAALRVKKPGEAN